MLHLEFAVDTISMVKRIPKNQPLMKRKETRACFKHLKTKILNVLDYD